MMLLAACALGASPLAACSSDDSFDDGADSAVLDSGGGDVDFTMHPEGNIFVPYDAVADTNTDDVVDASTTEDAADAADE